jgi:hypothetical protein
VFSTTALGVHAASSTNEPIGLEIGTVLSYSQQPLIPACYPGHEAAFTPRAVISLVTPESGP